MFRKYFFHLSVLVLVLGFFSFFFLTSASAQNLTDWKGVLDDGAGAGGAGYKTELTSPEPVIGVVIKTLLSLLGVLFLILMIYGGFTWMTAMGGNEKVEKAKNTITAAVIGLILVLVSYAVSYFVIKALTGATLSF